MLSVTGLLLVHGRLVGWIITLNPSPWSLPLTMAEKTPAPGSRVILRTAAHSSEQIVLASWHDSCLCGLARPRMPTTPCDRVRFARTVAIIQTGGAGMADLGRYTLLITIALLAWSHLGTWVYGAE